jgi:hypothetical protein
MSSPSPDRKELASWKEIAEYLGVTVRTAQKWETERGMPVRRLPGGSRGRVLVTTDELECWKLAGTLAPREEDSPRTSRTTALRWTVAIAVIATVILVVSSTPRVPASFRLERNVLAVFDAAGRELWRTALPGAIQDVDDSLYWFGDIAGQGQTDMLFAYRPANGEGQSFLYCYSPSGAERWRFAPGRLTKTRTESFSPPFHINAIGVFEASGTGAKWIVVSSHHAIYYPTQVALLDAQGHVLREYWHSGWLGVLKIADLDADGVPEILLGGVANSFQQAVLVALDPLTLGGASREENEDYQLLGFASPQERARILFPKSCLNRRSQVRNHVRGIRFEPEGPLVDVVEDQAENTTYWVNWHLNRTLQLRKLVVSDAFRARHLELEGAKTIHHRLTTDDSEFGPLRYLTGP